ncbi:MAG: DUF4031 domain-containing protein [Pseudonocardia sp.]
MTIYVDDARIRATVGNYTARWSHLFTDADDLAELHRFAQSIGLRRAWFQDKPSGPHYDLTDRLRRHAIHAGAHPVSWREVPTVWPNRRTQHQHPPTHVTADRSGPPHSDTPSTTRRPQ